MRHLFAQTRVKVTSIQDARGALNILDGYFKGQESPGPAPQTGVSHPEFLFQIGYSRIYRLDGAIIFVAGMQIDADGAPKAYHPDGKSGLDALANAGHPGNWWALVTMNGRPVIQTPEEPAPGYYVSTTALTNEAFPVADQRHYIDASAVPFIVLPSKLGMGLKLGDYCFCLNTATRDNDFGVFADIGPHSQIGEASIAMAEVLKVPSSPRTGGTGHGICYMIWPGTGNGFAGVVDALSKGNTLLTAFGGLNRVIELLKTGEIS